MLEYRAVLVSKPAPFPHLSRFIIPCLSFSTQLPSASCDYTMKGPLFLVRCIHITVNNCIHNTFTSICWFSTINMSYPVSVLHTLCEHSFAVCTRQHYVDVCIAHTVFYVPGLMWDAVVPRCTLISNLKHIR